MFVSHIRFYSLLCCMFLTSLAVAGVNKPIHFAPGTSGTVINGGVIRGERDTYRLQARPDQLMHVKIHSEEDNAVFQVYGEVEGNWIALHGAAEGDDATAWTGSSPDGGSGRFKIVVGSTRGNTSYTLEVSIE